MLSRINYKFRVALYVLLLGILHFPGTAAAQCGATRRLTMYWYQFTGAGCSGTSYTLDGYALVTGNFKSPLTGLAISSAKGGTPAVAASGDTLFLTGIVHAGPSSPFVAAQITFLDSCGNADTIDLVNYSMGNYLDLINSNGVYSLCDSSYRTTIAMQGCNSFLFSYYNPVTGTTDTLPSPLVSVSADSLVVFGLQPGNYYNIAYKDSCGNQHSGSYANTYLNNYTYNVSVNSYICDSTGLYGTVKPNLSNPFTYIGYTSGDTSAPAPLVQTGGDSILLGRLQPFNYYTFTFLDGCNDTFTVGDYALDNSTTANQAIFLEKNCSSYSIYVKTTGGPYYDARIESGLTAPGMTADYYTDSLVVSGLPVDSVNNQWVLSFRDSSCHNRRYVAYSLSWEGFATGANTNWSLAQDSCGPGYTVYARLAAIPPYTVTWIKKPNTPAVSYTGDTIHVANLLSLVTGSDDTLYSFVLQDACGQKDTFRIASAVNSYTGMDTSIVYNSGGCSGLNNAAAHIVLNNPYDTTAFPNPYSGLAINGPGSPSLAVSGDTFLLTNLTADSTYRILFRDTCGHEFRYDYTALSSNTPIVFTLTPSVEGRCMKNIDSSYAFTVQVANANYPYTAYLSGPVNDTITGVNTGQVVFSNLKTGTYQIKVEDACNNIQTLNYTLVSAGSLMTVSYANFSSFKGCDSFIYIYSKYTYTTTSSAIPGLVNNMKFRGPYSAYVVRGTDTFWSYFNDTIPTVSISMPFTFPSLDHINPLEQMYVIDGCGDTAVVTVQPMYLYYNQNPSCDSGRLSSSYTVTFNQPSYHLNFPLRLTYTSGTLADTSALYFYNNNQLDTLDFREGESACYHVTDTCNTDLGSICFSGPPALQNYYYTRLCNPPTSGQDKGNVNAYTYNVTSDSLLYHKISGPGTIADTVVSGGGLILNNIDTGTYVMTVTERNDCARTDTFTIRVEPFLDSLKAIFTPGCLNANKLVIYYYNNQYSSDYHVMTQSSWPPFYIYRGATYLTSLTPGDTLYNLQSNTDFYLTAANGCLQDTIHSPAYINPVIKASAGFHCGAGYSIAVLGTNGVKPYTYEILSGSPVSYTAPVQSSNVFTGLPNVSGNRYQVRLADACGNAFTTIIYADSVVNPLAEIGVNCIGNNYTASVDSIPNISYTWTGPLGFAHTGTSINFNPVAASDTGDYKLYITSNVSGCVTDTVHHIRLSDCIALPLAGINLYASWQNDHQATLYWTDESDYSVGYEVQRSDNGSDFTILANGKTTAFGQKSLGFRYVDEQPQARNFYRLKVTADGGSRVYYSAVVQLAHNTGNNGMSAVIIGSGTGNKLLMQHCPGEVLDVRIYNIQGAQMFHTGINAPKEAQVTYELPSVLASGLYIISIKTSEQTINLKWNATR